MKKEILFLAYCIIPLCLYAQRAKQNNETKKWGYEQIESKTGWWKNAKNRGYSLLDKSDRAALVNHYNEINWFISPQYEAVTKTFTEKLAGVVVGGKVGFIDMNNRFVIPPQFENVDNVHGFNLGLSAVKKDGKFGFINKRGEFVIEPQFDYADNFKDNLLATVKQDGKFGAINIRGELVVPCKYILEEAMITVPISNKLYRQKQAEVKNAKSNGEFDEILEKLTECSKAVNKQIDNDEIQLITDSLQIIEANGKVGLKAGTHIVIPVEYDELNMVEDGIVIACKGSQWGAWDIYGRSILPCTYRWVYYDSPAQVFVANGLAFGLYNSRGSMLLPDRLDYIGNFVDGKAPVWLSSVQGWVDVNGQISDGFADALIKKFQEEEEKGVSGAFGLFNLLTDLMPENAMGHYYFGKGMVANNLFSKGMEHLKIAAELDPHNTEIAEALKLAKKDKKKRTLNTIGYVASVNNDLESTNTNSFKKQTNNQENSMLGLGASMEDFDALGGSTGTEVTGGGERCTFLRYVLEDLEKKIQKNTGKLQDQYYQQMKQEFLQSANKEGCEL